MNKVKKLLLWFLMLSKRLYKKPTFLVLILLIPVLMFGYIAISGGESGVMTIGMVCQEQDPITDEIFKTLQNDQKLMSFRVYQDAKEAQALLESGKLDAVWIFPGDMEQRIKTFVQQPTVSNGLITVLERESNVALALTHEKLSGIIYPYLAEEIYVDFMRDLAPELSHLSDEDLLTYYHGTNLSIDLFNFANSEGQKAEASYLLSPLRGLLGVLILLCSLATAMYFIQDERKGTFAWVSQQWRFLPELGCHLASSLHVSVVCLICLMISGLAGNIWVELAVLLLYSLCCSAFAMAIRQVFGSLRTLGTMLPLILVISMVVCPVFFDLGSFRRIQYALPPTYYINSIFNSRYLLYMLVYIVCSAGFVLAAQYVKDHSRRRI